MSENQPCPQESRLSQLLEGTLNIEQEAALAEHLRDCVACRKRFDELAGGDRALVGASDTAADDSPQDDDAFIQMMDQLRAERPEKTIAPTETAADSTYHSRFLNTETSLGFLSPSDRSQSLGRLGEYEIAGVVGSGGMGMVLRAQQTTLERTVAVKVLKPDKAANAVARKRFTEEARKAAAISHDHVVTIHGVGEENGFPYIVMEYIVGISLEDRIRRTGTLKVAEVLRIGMQAAAGLAAAHAQGLVHRDIKPANILLENGVERVKITDFGLARATDDTQLTESGVVAGTPEYMSPEQAEGHRVDHRSDLFSLGAVMYAMCTGRSPFRGKTVAAVIRRVCDDTPRPIRGLNPEIPDWLVQIIDRLLAKNPDDRFQTAEEVRALLGQYLAHLQQPEEMPMPKALPPQAAHWGRDQRRMNWPLALTVMTLTALLFVVCGRMFWPENSTDMVSATPGGAADAVPGPIPNPTGPKRPLLPEDPAKLIVDIVAGGAKKDHSWTRTTIKGVGNEFVWSQPDPHIEYITPGPCWIEVRDKATDRLLRSGEFALSPGGTRTIQIPNQRQYRQAMQPQTQPLSELLNHSAAVQNVVLSPDDRLLATAGLDNKVILSSRMNKGWQRQSELVGRCCAFTANGSQIITGCVDGQIHTYDVQTGHEQHTTEGHMVAVKALALSATGILASLDVEGNVMLWERGKQDLVPRDLPSQQDDPAKCISIAIEGTVLAVGHESGDLSVWDTEAGKELIRFQAHSQNVNAVVFSPDSSLIASGGKSACIGVWDATTGERITGLGQARWSINSLAFSTKGDKLVAGCGDQSIKAWDVHDGTLLNDFHADWGAIDTLAFSGDGKTLISGASCNSVRFWDVHGLPGRIEKSSPLRHQPPLSKRVYMGHVTFCFDVRPDAEEVVMTRFDGYAISWDLTPKRSGQGFRAHQAGSLNDSVHYLEGGRTVATSGQGNLRFWDSSTLEKTGEITHGREMAIFDVSHDDQFVATIDSREKIVLWNTETGEREEDLTCPRGNIACIKFHPQRSVLAIGTTDGEVLFCDLGDEPRDFEAICGLSSTIRYIDFSPDGNLMVATGPNALPEIWNVGGRSRVEELVTGFGGAITASFSHDGALLAVGYDTDEADVACVTLWDTETWKPRTTWQEPGYMQKAQFASDGKLWVLTDASYLSCWDVPAFLAENEDK
jgi:serine/threonine protein kinase/WD40 repeat protein